MYNFRLETLLYFARIRQLEGTFRSAAFYGFGDLYDPCVVTITVQSGVMLSCTIYNRYSQVLKITKAMMDVLHHTTVAWTFEDAGYGYTYGQTSPAYSPPTPPLPDLNPPPPTPREQAKYAQTRKTTPLNNMRNPQHSDQFQAETISYPPPTKNPTRPFTFATEPHYPISPNNNKSTQNDFLNLIPLRLKAVPRSEVLQWKGNIKSIYMRTNGINTITQIATMLSLPAADVLQILRQLEKDGLISLRKPV